MGGGNDLNWAKQHLYSSLALTSPKLFGTFFQLFKLPDFLQRLTCFTQHYNSIIVDI